jgi:type IV secretory pathway VirB9-like protein
MNSMMPKTTYPYVMIIISAAALLSGCVTGDQAPPRIAQNDPLTIRSAFHEKAATSDGVVTGAQHFPYEKDALYQLRAAVGSPSTIELQPGETLINYALGDGSLWIVDDVDGAEQTLLQVEPTQPDLSTHLLINTDKRSYLVEATSHQGDAPEATLAWIYPHEQVDQPITAVEAGNERLGETVAAPSEGNAISWSRWFADMSKTSSDSRGCRLCRDSDDHGDNDHGRDHDSADHHGMR